MAWSASLLINQVCSNNCDSSHTVEERIHLPLGLWRATHDGNSDGTIPSNSGLEADGCMLPRVLDWHLRTHDVERHLDKSNRSPTPFLSFGTWELVRSRIPKWKQCNVRNIRLHFMALSLLPETTPVYRATGLVHKMNLDFKPYLKGEYLVHGKVPASALIHHCSGEGDDCLVEFPATRPSILPGLDCTSVACYIPNGFFGATRPSTGSLDYPRDHLGAAVYDAEYLNLFLVVSDSITGGKLFTADDYVRYYNISRINI